ncbi:hypothetical protein EAH68_02335 [Corynebacterium hylobatis]|uniref:Alpha helical Porin B n=1 Tax=Corynebacterium hylobatis TaxID=1859290 RepID=A0A430I1C2_9CORY|nr:hypothetical protein [Corynebacterium hylobatis]RSZ65608.1 hypothetical protein EAH68_02335 [Corynebacterium hylobatis]
MLRRTLATVAATATVVVGLAPAASAQLGDLNAIVSQGIANTPCNQADPLLKAVFTIDGNTTRSDLVKQVRDEAKPFTVTDPATYLVSAQFAEQIGDKAVACGTVKKDPEFFPGSSIPDMDNIQDLLQGLSATLN